MRLNVLLWMAALVGAFLPRPADGRPAARPPSLLIPMEDDTSSNARLLQLLLHSLQGPADHQKEEELEEEEKGKRSEDSPISLDLTFHLLREVLEMARAEQIAQQADSNRKVMDSLGK